MWFYRRVNIQSLSRDTWQPKSFPNVSLEKSLGQRSTTWDRSTRKFLVIPHSVSATSAGGLTIWKMSICSKNVKALLHPERYERHENSENIQCYSELDGGMLRPEVHEIFKSPKPFQFLAGWISDFGLHILVDTSFSVMNSIQSCFNKYALQTYYYFLTYFPQSSTYVLHLTFIILGSFHPRVLALHVPKTRNWVTKGKMYERRWHE